MYTVGSQEQIIPLAQKRGAEVVAGGDWWDQLGSGVSVVGAWQAVNAASYAASLVNLPNPGTYDLSEGNGAVPWDADGWGFVRALAQWLDTGVVPGDTWSMLVQFANVAPTTSWLCGCFSGAPSQRFDLAPYNAGSWAVYGHGIAGNQVLAVPTIAAGNLGVAGKQCYRNGTSDGVLGAGVGTYTLSIYVGDLNGFATGKITADIESLAIYSATLTAPQMLAVATAMDALSP